MDIFAFFMSFFVKPTPPEEKKVDVAPIVVEKPVETVEKVEKKDTITPSEIKKGRLQGVGKIEKINIDMEKGVVKGKEKQDPGKIMIDIENGTVRYEKETAK